MAETTVYGCDWCDTIIEKNRDGRPHFAMRVTAEPLPRIATSTPDVYRICSDCTKAFKALTQGKYRRG